ncbi:MAG: 30S ribosomal protein S12 methylthiotransferase RimO [Deltaproteobacteria bacterium]
MNIGFISLGCAKNRVDTETMMGSVKREGHKIVNSLEKADAIIINTCGFIQSAKEEAIDTILETARYKETGGLKYLVATGCLCQRYGNELYSELPELDAVLGIGYFSEVAAVLGQLESGQRMLLTSAPPTLYPAGTARILTTPPGSAYLRVTDGCNNRCAYCTIPEIRGNLRSRPFSDICREARKLADSGIKELVLIAQDTAAYGQDENDQPGLTDLLTALNEVPGLEWIRLMYVHPRHIKDELIGVIEGLDKVIPYLDIPVQHSSDHLLKAMNRGHDSSYLRDLISKLRSNIGSLVLRTTVMVGFPGETEDDFQKLLDFIDEIKFDWLGSFAYVREEGTAAYGMPGQVEEEIKEDRLQQVMLRQARITRSKNIARLDKREKVLISSQLDKNLFVGRTWFQAPEVDGLTLIKSDIKLARGEFFPVYLKAVRNTDLIGEAIYESA